MPETTAAKPVYTYDLQYYIDISDTAGTDNPVPAYSNVTEDTKFDPTRDYGTYSPSYKNRKVQPEFDTTAKYAIDLDIDIYENQDLQEWLRVHEDDKDVPTSVVRVWANEGQAATRPAKMAGFGMTLNPLDGPAGEPLKGTGKLKMTTDGWTAGTFNEGTKVFTPTAG